MPSSITHCWCIYLDVYAYIEVSLKLQLVFNPWSLYVFLPSWKLAQRGLSRNRSRRYCLQFVLEILTLAIKCRFSSTASYQYKNKYLGVMGTLWLADSWIRSTVG